MSIVNFEVKKPLDQRIKGAISKYGFSSRAEFFRFAAIDFLNKEKNKISEGERLEFLVANLRRAILKKFNGKKPVSLKKQLADV